MWYAVVNEDAEHRERDRETPGTELGTELGTAATTELQSWI